MTKAELIDAVQKDLAASDVNLSKKAVKGVIDSTLSKISETITGGEEILLLPLGRFTTKARKARKASNMVTGETLDVPARHVPIFNPATSLKEAVAKLPIN